RLLPDGDVGAERPGAAAKPEAGDVRGQVHRVVHLTDFIIVMNRQHVFGKRFPFLSSMSDFRCSSWQP
ncbi:hypothetical protein, partial [Pantoea ananatis]|uniref:hypothetical protein n=1 Tax=Pantoea ananas TaxID=553 RepID=UPI0023B1C312